MGPFVMYLKKLVRNKKEPLIPNEIQYFFNLGIFSSTIKNNILFGKEYNPKLFQCVINATALDTVC